MPFRMHSEYLRRDVPHNDLAEGRYRVGGRPIAISAIRGPIFAVGTETDHVAPWRSVYKIHLLNEGDITFVLTSGGHNAGIVSEPGHPRRHYRIGHRPAQGGISSRRRNGWRRPTNRGSWWADLVDMAERSFGRSPSRRRRWPLRQGLPGDLPMRRAPMCAKPERGGMAMQIVNGARLRYGRSRTARSTRSRSATAPASPHRVAAGHRLFAVVSGDVNPAHMDPAYAEDGHVPQDHRAWHAGGRR